MKLELFAPLAVFKANENGGFDAFSPSAPGAVSEGRTLAEARAIIKEAVEGVLHVALEEGYNKYFNIRAYRAKRGETVEAVPIDQRLQVAVT